MAPQNRQTILAGQPPVKDHQLPGRCPDGLPGGVVVWGVLDSETFIQQAGDDRLDKACIILDNQDPTDCPACHRRSPIFD